MTLANNERVKEQASGAAAPRVQRVHFWYHTEGDFYTADMPDDVRNGVWVFHPADKVWKNEISGEEVSSELPPDAKHARHVLKKRVMSHLEKADLSVNEYKDFWREEMQEIMEAKARRLSSMLIQRSWRAYKGRCRFQVLKFRTRHSITCQRVARGFLGRRRALREKKMLKVALKIQRVWRGRESRRKLQEVRSRLERRAVLQASILIERVWRECVGGQRSAGCATPRWAPYGG